MQSQRSSSARQILISISCGGGCAGVAPPGRGPRTRDLVREPQGRSGPTLNRGRRPNTKASSSSRPIQRLFIRPSTARPPSTVHGPIRTTHRSIFLNSNLTLTSSLSFGIGFPVGFVVVRSLWRWCTVDWPQRRVQLDVDRFNALNRHMPGAVGSRHGKCDARKSGSQ